MLLLPSETISARWNEMSSNLTLSSSKPTYSLQPLALRYSMD